jgi:hypothetical protein
MPRAVFHLSIIMTMLHVALSIGSFRKLGFENIDVDVDVGSDSDEGLDGQALYALSRIFVRKIISANLEKQKLNRLCSAFTPLHRVGPQKYKNRNRNS